ncbi:MAG: tRNA (guanosine(37)-N1)-methyltransferase TrmD [Spirochaetaceae bacterium]|jgi:tRNA (guanine37-N1)-methyltransferase|nr:tRNA (guanosine(37)-N1)-methyltransferase TrmD [Spirochaetaceae bacterium]
MNFTVITLFPAVIDAYFTESIPAKAVEKGLIGYKTVQIRDFARDAHKTCDDAPYGGGAGMLLLAAPLSRALESAGILPKGGEAAMEGARPRVAYLSPSGRPFTQEKAAEFSRLSDLALICGRYEGIDARIIERYVDEEISVGDYVLSSGELAALVVIDAVHRLVEGVITRESLTEESFSGGLLEYPQWTRPEEFDRMRVPEVLLSGHHERIRLWRLERRVEKTMRNRPDLLEKGIREGVFDKETRDLIEKAAQGADKEQWNE